MRPVASVGPASLRRPSRSGCRASGEPVRTPRVAPTTVVITWKEFSRITEVTAASGWQGGTPRSGPAIERVNLVPVGRALRGASQSGKRWNSNSDEAASRDAAIACQGGSSGFEPRLPLKLSCPNSSTPKTARRAPRHRFGNSLRLWFNQLAIQRGTPHYDDPPGGSNRPTSTEERYAKGLRDHCRGSEVARL